MFSAALLVVGCGLRHGAEPDACPRSDVGTQYTPGTVECGDIAACSAGRCVICFDPVGNLTQVCGTPPPDMTCNYSIGCDGPEDCAVGERCYAFESTFCKTPPWDSAAYVVCHTDADCDCGEHCDYDECRPNV